MKFLLLSTFIFTSLFCLSAQENTLQSFILNVHNNTISLSLPNTWIIDTNFAKEINVTGFFYLKNYASNTSPAGIVLQLIPISNYNSFSQFISSDIESFLSEPPPGYKAQIIDNQITSIHHYSIVIYKVFSSNSNVYHYSAYFDCGLPFYIHMYIRFFSRNSSNDILLNDFYKCISTLKIVYNKSN